MRRTKEVLMGDLLAEFFERPFVKAKVAEGSIPEAWADVVGARAAAATTRLRLEKHVLYAEMSSSVIRSELFYRREAITAQLNERLGIKIINVLILK